MVLGRVEFGDLSGCLAAEVRRRIRERGLTGRGLAAKCGFSQPTMSNWLNGRRRLSVGGCDSVLAALGLGVGDLVGLAAAGDCPAVDPDRPRSRVVRIDYWRRRRAGIAAVLDPLPPIAA